MRTRVYGRYAPAARTTLAMKDFNMSKNKHVSHSKQETVSVIFTHPSPNPSASQNIVLQYAMTNLT